MPPSVTTAKHRWQAPIVFTGSVFAIIDDGRAQPEEYLEAEALILAKAAELPGGLGCMVIVPAGAKPPPDAQRKAIDGVLTRLSSHLRGLAWVVEGRGFGGAAVRAVLIGLSLYGRRPYPTQVSSSVDDALGWLLTKLGTDADQDAVEAASRRIAEARAEYSESR
jgi:hypothetical protein